MSWLLEWKSEMIEKYIYNHDMILTCNRTDSFLCYIISIEPSTSWEAKLTLMIMEKILQMLIPGCRNCVGFFLQPLWSWEGINSDVIPCIAFSFLFMSGKQIRSFYFYFSGKPYLVVENYAANSHLSEMWIRRKSSTI